MYGTDSPFLAISWSICMHLWLLDQASRHGLESHLLTEVLPDRQSQVVHPLQASAERLRSGVHVLVQKGGFALGTSSQDALFKLQMWQRGTWCQKLIEFIDTDGGMGAVGKLIQPQTDSLCLEIVLFVYRFYSLLTKSPFWCHLSGLELGKWDDEDLHISMVWPSKWTLPTGYDMYDVLDCRSWRHWYGVLSCLIIIGSFFAAEFPIIVIIYECFSRTLQLSLCSNTTKHQAPASFRAVSTTSSDCSSSGARILQ